MDIQILIATHKKVEMPKDSVYVPIHVGRENKEDLGFIGDNTGDNISIKNPCFSELTAIYWAWKNLNCDYVGLVHYRRFLSRKKTAFFSKKPLSSSEAKDLCKVYDIILPRKRNYFIETIWSHYQHTHDIKHLEITRSIIKNESPEYLSSFNTVMNRRSAHMFNMFLMKKEFMNEYCNWLFKILFHLEERIEISSLSPFDARLFGRVSEFLLDVWIDKNGYKYKEIGYFQFGNNFFSKLRNFFKAKFLKVKYSQSA